MPLIGRIGEGEEGVADDLLHLLIARPGNAQPFVECLGGFIVGVDGQSEVDAAVLPALRRDTAQQAFADPAAAKPVRDIEVLHIDAGPAHPGRKDREMKAQAGELAADFGDQGREGRLFAKAIGPESSGVDLISSGAPMWMPS